ncbi:hypothetical protein ACWCPR_31500, partial [Streptomyces rubiginosohelvolus]
FDSLEDFEAAIVELRAQRPSAEDCGSGETREVLGADAFGAGAARWAARVRWSRCRSRSGSGRRWREPARTPR